MNMKVLLPLAVILVFTACASRPRPNDKFIVELSSPRLPAGEIETQIDRAFPLIGLKKIIVDVSYYPYDDAVCLRYRSDFFNYYQFWSKAGREVFLSALEKYNVDYSARDLAAKNRKSKKTYGGTEGYLIWQMYSLTRRAQANMDMELGYAFKDNSPYYAVTQKLASYIDNINKENNMNSQEITMYFTRAQAQELATLFDQDFLRGLVSPEMGGVRRVNEADIDADSY